MSIWPLPCRSALAQAGWSIALDSGRRTDHRADLVRIRRRREIIDHHAEIRPAIDRERRIFEGERAENRVSYMFEACAMAVDFVIAPHCLEFGAEPAEFIDEGFHLCRRPRARRAHPDPPHHQPR